MQLPLRPWISASVALTGAAFFVVPPAAAPLSEVQAQHRQVNLKSYDEFDFSQLASTTTANIDALQGYFSDNPFTSSPDVAQGFSTLLTDLATGQSNPVTNPLSLLAEGALGLLSSGYGFNAASTALTGVADNVQAALGSGDYTAAFNDLAEGPTTVLYAALNGYPETVGSLLSPEFGLLTSPGGVGLADGSHLATGTLYAVNQLETTLAHELSALGGGNLTTGSLPEVTGNVDLSVSVDQALNEILNALGFSSGGGVLTVNQLLTDLGVDPTSNLLPTVDIGEVLSLLGLSDKSGISLGTILGDLGLNGNSSISLGTILGDLGLSNTSSIDLGTILGDLGLSDTSGISVGQILTDLGFSDSSTITIPAISVGAILDDLGLSDTSSISLPTLSLGTILGDLGLSDTSSISLPTLSLGTILGDLGLSDSSNISIPNISVPVSTILSDLNINPGGSISIGGESVSLPVTTLLSALGINPSGSISIPISLTVLGQHINQNVSVSVSTILNAFGINTGGSETVSLPALTVPISTILNDLGINQNGSLSFGVPSINLGEVLSALHLSDSTSITPPDINLGDVLTTLGFNDNTTITPPDINLGDVLNVLGLTDSSTITPPDINLGDVLSTLGLNDNSTLGIGAILSGLGLSDTSKLDIGEILSGLGLSDNSSVGISQVLDALGLSDSSTLGIGSVLNALGLSDSTTIPLPSFSLDSVLTELGINPNESLDALLTQLGVPDTLTLSPALDLTGSGVPLYDLNLSQDLLAAVGSIQSLSSDLPSLLTTEPTLALTPLLSDLVADLGLPFSVTGGDLALNLTNVLAEVLPTLF